MAGDEGLPQAADLATLGGAAATAGGVLLAVAPIVVSAWNSFHAHSLAGKLASMDATPEVRKVDLEPTTANAAIASKLSDKVTA